MDNDILLKLIAFQLMDEAIATLDIKRNDLRVLPTAKYVFQSYRSKQKHYPDDVLTRAIAFVEACCMIDGSTSPDSLAEAQQLESLRDWIDEGERSLIIATRTSADFLLLSGDKRCISALASLPPSICQRLCGRVVCLELLIFKLIDKLGFEKVRDCIRPTASYDKALEICFGYSIMTPQDQVIQGLKSYINDLQHLAPGLLASD